MENFGKVFASILFAAVLAFIAIKAAGWIHAVTTEAFPSSKIEVPVSAPEAQ